MRPNDVRVFLQHRPFQPFRITLADGRTLPVLASARVALELLDLADVEPRHRMAVIGNPDHGGEHMIDMF